MKNPILIAEIGCNHKGDMEIAKSMIETAKNYCKADVVKFQKRHNKTLLSEKQYNSPHPNPMNAYGSTYGEHREFLEFTLEQHDELKNHSEGLGIIYSTSVWDIVSAKEIASLHPKLIKIPSACNNDTKMLHWLCNNYEGEIHISIGMTTNQEIEEFITIFDKNNRCKDLVIYSCTSGYPVPFEDVCLLELIKLKEKYGSEVKDIGFSGHHLGIAVDVAALTLGASVIERHFTHDRTWKGTDHAASLEPDGLKKLKRDLLAVSQALTYKKEEILDIEKIQREKLKVQK